MSEIKIFEKDLTFVGIIDSYKELRFERKFFNSGSFFLELHEGVKYSEQLTENRIIMISNNVNKVGIIQEVKEITENDKTILQITGRELKAIFMQRVTIPSDGQSHQSFTNTEIETIVKSVVSRNCVDLTSYKGFDLSFPELIVDVDQSRGSFANFNTRYKNLESEIENILRVGGLGSKVYLDLSLKKWRFDISEGKNLVSGGPALNPVIFSTEYDNIKKQVYVKSNLNSSNGAIVGGQGDGASRIIEGSGDTSKTGLDLKFIFIDARDLSSTNDLISRGEEKLSLLEPVEAFDCDILTKSNYEYEVDYDIGDIVTIRNPKRGVEINKRIESITEFYSGVGNSFEITISFGKELKTLKEYIDISADLSKGGVV